MNSQVTFVPATVDINERRAELEKLNAVEHVEPVCEGECGHKDPHRHGLFCFKDCTACKAVCHPECPAN